MNYKGPIKKLDEFIWEIPQSYKPCMRVPARIFADKSLLDKMKTDLTLEQAANIACLPGVYKYSIVLPDGHQGYGFPIGGVAASDAETGVISPGGVGYDINCLSPSTKVLTEHGYWIKVEELPKKFKTESIKIYNISEGHNDSSKIMFVTEREIETGELAIRVLTENGRLLEGSEDHPVLTPRGYKMLSDLKKGDCIVIYPFEGVKYEELNDVILSEEEFREYGPQIFRYLKERKLIPLKMNDPKIGILAKLLGYALGDGSIVHEKGEGDGIVLKFFGRKDELKKISRELEKIGVKTSRIYSRTREMNIKTAWGGYGSEYHDNSIKITSEAFTLLMHKLGIPIEKKMKKTYKVPEWIKKAPMWVKRNFLAGLFGADGSKVTFKGYMPLPINFAQSKNAELEDDLIAFLNDIRALLEEFGVKSITYNIKSLHGKVTYRLSIVGEESIKNFLGKIGYEFSREKQTLGLIAYEYLRRKERIKTREEAEEFAKKNYKETESMSEAYKSVKRKYINRRLIERGGYKEVKEVKIIQDFPKFKEFAKKFGLKGGFVLDRVTKVERIRPSYDKFYDLGIYHKEHNFIANGVVVHNCGVRLMRTNLKKDEVRKVLPQLLEALFRNIPSGVGSTGKLRLSGAELDEAMQGGAKWAVEQGYGWDEDWKHCEEEGAMPDANPDMVSSRAKQRGRPQLGTLGSGNHFLEIQYVDKIYNPEIAKKLGIYEEGQVTVMIHTGSRGFGHQVCSDYLRVMERAVHQYGIKLPDRELACAPAHSKEAEQYFQAMQCAANFAWANRQLITHWTRESFQKVFRKDAEDLDLHLIYDVAHNIAKLEEHVVDDKRVKVFVHRKGATRAFPPGHRDIPADYREMGQPVLIPGSMGTASYLLIGTKQAMKISFGSTAHGAGRHLSRAAATRRYWGSAVKKELEQRGILIRAANIRVVAEEAPGAYKDIDRIAMVSHKVGIATLVARMVPMGVTKG